MTSVEAAIQEIDNVLSVLQPQLEGLRDFDRLNIDPDTHAIIQVAIGDYFRREQLLLTAKAALVNLVADGHPDIDVREIPQIIYKNLKDNVDTISAAFSKFSPDKAVNLNINSGTPEFK